MISDRQDIIRRELETGTGAAIGMAVDQTGTRTGLRLWFADLDDRHGPVAELRPYGIRGYRVALGFGKFAGEVVRQIQSAGAEDVDGLGERQADDVAGAAVDPFDERAARGLHAVGTRLVAVLADAEVPVDVGVGQLPERHVGGDDCGDRRSGRPADHGRVHLMGTARQRLEHPTRVLVVVGFGQDVVVEIDRGIGGEHTDAAVAIEQVGDLLGLVDRDPFDIGTRVFAPLPRLVDIGGLDAERQAQPLEQLLASR